MIETVCCGVRRTSLSFFSLEGAEEDDEAAELGEAAPGQ
jgi:hypothetical protein